MKNWHVAVIAVSVFLLLLGCNLGSSTPSGQSAPTPTTAPATAQPVKVSLTWDKPVDMDLEIWNASGQNMIHKAYPTPDSTPPFKGENCGTDVQDGSTPEFWIFKRTTTEDFSNGEYLVSVAFPPETNRGAITSASATLTITKPDGSTTTCANTLKVGKTNWHAIRINATTGEYTVVNEIIDYQ